MSDILYEDKKTSSWIETCSNDGIDTEVFICRPHPDVYIRFNVHYVPKNSYKWFCSVVGKEFKNACAIADAKAIEQMQTEFKMLLGINQ